MGARRCDRWLGVFLAALTLLASARLDADVINWQTGETIPGTEGIVPGPGLTLIDRDLAFADFAGLDLTAARFNESRLENARFTQTNLVRAQLRFASLANADFTDANIQDAFLRDTTARGFTQEQLYSTASYQAKDLSGVDFAFNDLTGWNFAGQNLTGADFVHSTISGADLTDAVVVGVRFQQMEGFTEEQLYSTASYKSMDLHSVNLKGIDMSGWSFAGQNLINARFGRLTGADLTNAVVQGAELPPSFTKEQLYSTLSYKMKDLGSIGLSGVELDGWDLSRQSLVNADLRSTLTDTDLRQSNLTSVLFGGATLTNTNLTDAVVRGAEFSNVTRGGFTKEQLYSTASYKMKDLGSINLSGNDLSGWDFAQQNLVNARFISALLDTADFSQTDLSNADFTLATLRGANFSSALLFRADFRDATLTGADLRSALVADEDLVTADTRNTIMPDGTIQGLSLGNDDRLVVRDHALPVTIEQSMSLEESATLQIIVSDPDWTSTIHFADDVILNLAGTLTLSVDPNANARDLVGVTFQIFDFDGRAATKRFNQIHFDKGTDWDTSNLYTTGEVTLTEVPEPSTLLLTMLGLIGLVSLPWRTRRREF